GEVQLPDVAADEGLLGGGGGVGPEAAEGLVVAAAAEEDGAGEAGDVAFGGDLEEALVDGDGVHDHVLAGVADDVEVLGAARAEAADLPADDLGVGVGD